MADSAGCAVGVQVHGIDGEGLGERAIGAAALELEHELVGRVDWMGARNRGGLLDDERAGAVRNTNLRSVFGNDDFLARAITSVEPRRGVFNDRARCAYGEVFHDKWRAHGEGTGGGVGVGVEAAGTRDGEVKGEARWVGAIGQTRDGLRYGEICEQALVVEPHGLRLCGIGNNLYVIRGGELPTDRHGFGDGAGSASGHEGRVGVANSYGSVDGGGRDGLVEAVVAGDVEGKGAVVIEAQRAGSS